MNRRNAFFLFVLFAAYVAFLFYVELSRPAGRERLPVSLVLPAATACCWFIRYLRWAYLLKVLDFHQPFWKGLVIYILGFAYTATPGKAGELVRVAYLRRFDRRTSKVYSAFIAERFCDFVVMTALGGILLIGSPVALLAVIVFFVILASVLALTGMSRRFPKLLAWPFRKLGLNSLVKFIFRVRSGIRSLVNLLSLRTVAVMLLSGLIGWTIYSLGVVWYLHYIGFDLPFYASFSVYPAAMVSGAVSMIPGGLGGTEAVFCLVLGSFSKGGPVLEAAFMVRCLTMWFSVAAGLLCQGIVFLHDVRENRRQRASGQPSGD